MRFYHICDGYIDFLKQYDNKVADNKHESRPYIGIVFSIGDFQYYAPFSSPKPKHQSMKNGKDLRKIAGGRYGVINLNNMIPVPEDALIAFDISEIADERYRRLLQNQYVAISNDWDIIVDKASKLHALIHTPYDDLSEYDCRVKARCCNLPLLESVFEKYMSAETVAIKI